MSNPTVAQASARSLPIPDAFVEAVALRAAEIVLERVADVTGSSSPFLSVDEAAEYLRCDRQRVYDLLSSRRLPKFKDGSRVLVRREDVAAYVARSLPSSSRSRMERATAA